MAATTFSSEELRNGSSSPQDRIVTSETSTETRWVTQTAPSSVYATNFTVENASATTTTTTTSAAIGVSDSAKTCFFTWSHSEAYCYIIYGAAAAVAVCMIALICGLLVYSSRMKSKIRRMVVQRDEDVELMRMEQKSTAHAADERLSLSDEELTERSVPLSPTDRYDGEDDSVSVPEPTEPRTQQWPAPPEDDEAQQSEAIPELTHDEPSNQQFKLSEEQNDQLDNILNSFMQIADDGDVGAN